MMNMQSMMKQAQKLQKLLTELSESLYKLSEYKETRLFISNFFIVQKAVSATKKWSIKEG